MSRGRSVFCSISRLGGALALLAASASFGCTAEDEPVSEDVDAATASVSMQVPLDAAPPVDGGRMDASEGEPFDASSDGRVDASRADSGPLRDARADDATSAMNDAASVRDAASDGSDAGPGQCARGKDAPAALPLRGDLGAHDPVLIESDGQYFAFVTGRGIPTKRSSDLLNWQRGEPVFSQNPSWIAQRVPGATDLWAPDISQFGGSFHLYYSVSTFGSNRSCIGHATRASLASGSWQDRGAVICSNADGARHDWNAIDPNVVLDESGTPWLAFGSFWSGLKLIKLTAAGARADDALHAIAGRNGGAIEAPFIVRRCGEYYLFVSFDSCCRGADSTYRIMVGRARTITGPYLDRRGVALTQGGGTQVLSGDARWRGPGHNAILLTARGDYNVYHAYAANDGHSELRISELSWDDAGWPVSAGP